MEIKNILDAEFKTLIIMILEELSKDFNRIKNIQSEMKETLNEIKNNLQGTKSRVDAAKNQINDLEHKEGKKTPKKPTNQNSKKKKRIQSK